MVKKSGNKSTDEHVYIPGQAYHMDLAFVSGPAKLDDLRTTAEESVTLKQSREGYIGFLTIIDVASRQLGHTVSRTRTHQRSISINFLNVTV